MKTWSVVDAVELVFLGFVIGVCVTRLKYEGPGPWWAWVLGVAAGVGVLLVVSRSKRSG